MAYPFPKYPGDIPDSDDLPQRVDDIHDVMAVDWNAPIAELLACLSELGTNPKGGCADLKTRIAGAVDTDGHLVLHASDHHAAGTDEVDIKDLADTASRLLTGTDKTDLIDGGNTTIHKHDGRYYTEAEINTKVAALLTRDPDYDSGEFNLAAGAGVTKAHNLSSMNILVYLTRHYEDEVAGQRDIHGLGRATIAGDDCGFWWTTKNNQQINIYRAADDPPQGSFRVQIWKLE